jgi:hypothetical protein
MGTTIDFYTRVLDMTVVTINRVMRLALAMGI